MSISKYGLAVRLMPVALAAGVIGMVGGGNGSDGVGTAHAGSGGLKCEIAVKKRGSSVELEGIVYAQSKVQGSYSLTVTKSGGGGSSDISQNGDFSAGPGSPGSIGNVMIGGDGGNFVAKLRVTADGASAQCVERGRL